MFFIEGNGERTTSLHTELKKRSAVRTSQKKNRIFNMLSADLGCGPGADTFWHFFIFWGISKIFCLKSGHMCQFVSIYIKVHLNVSIAVYIQKFLIFLG